ncbi:unnamed protein product [Meganyctiphanes norvegica]|uniref:C-type lectin domain-containing protein n=1 Tax=Meganyctiphanes norvegica TaxID=48144 RepID=A0AAV2PSM7_MEGNR
MLDYDNDEDLAVLDAISTMDNKYWVGGSTADGLSWEWLDGREVYITAPFWYLNEPNEAQNKCMIAQTKPHGTFKSGQLYDYNCDDSINFICQARHVCPSEFRRIGNYCYFVSHELENQYLTLTWSDARDYCKALSVPVGYHPDLAVLGLPDQGDTYRLMSNLMESSTWRSVWIGGLGDSDCNYAWVTGETIPASTFYWFSSDPNCGSTYRVVIYRIPSYHNRTFLHTYTETDEFPFICQMYPGNN